MTAAGRCAAFAAVFVVCAGCGGSAGEGASQPSQPTAASSATATTGPSKPAPTSSSPGPQPLDTGDYAVVPLPPFGAAGSEAAGRRVEAHRMAPFVVGPWQVDEALRDGASPAASIVLSPDDIGLHIWPFMAAGTAGLQFVVGFVSDRHTADARPTSLRNEVLRFADDVTAAAAAAGVANAGLNTTPAEPSFPIPTEPVRVVPVPGHDDSTGLLMTFDDGGQPVQELTVVTAHGPYLLVQVVRSAIGPDDAAALAGRTLDLQIPLLAGFQPTDPAKFADLPVDPTGLVARTLPRATIDETPLSGSAYPPAGALHAELDPVAAGPQWSTAGVDQVSLGLTTVYQTRDPGAATQLAVQLGDAAAARPTAQSGTGVPGLPLSRCIGGSDAPGAVSNNLCLVPADRYVVTALGRDLGPVQQQLAAQYRMLTS